MYELNQKNVLVVGLTGTGRSACRLLRRRGANVTAVDRLDIPDLRQAADELSQLGVVVELGRPDPPPGSFDLAVVSPEIPESASIMRSLRQARTPVISELELGYQQLRCLNISISGTNGKTSCADLIAKTFQRMDRRTRLAGNGSMSTCDVADDSHELDFLTIEASAFQLERTKYFRPSIAVLLNIGGDHPERYASHADYVRTKARLFENQQAFDWAIVQSEALAQMRALGLSIPGKVITFSASNRRADIFLDRTLLVSRLEGWTGPLLDLNDCVLQGPHHAENLMAALAVGRVLRFPLQDMVAVLKTAEPLPHRCEVVGEVDGVKFINDSKSLNIESLQSALLSVPQPRGQPNVWLIAGGKDLGFDYHAVGPILSQRVRGAFLIGEMREKLRAAWSLFTPCTTSDSLIEALSQAAEKAEHGDTIVFSPACSSFDQFQNYQQRGEVFRKAVQALARTRNGGQRETEHNRKRVLV